MSNGKWLRSAALAAGLGLAASVASAQPCGEPPEAPEIVDGAQASMEDMVTNSQAVKGFIQEADGYLDCREAMVETEEFKEMSDEEKVAWLKQNKQVLKVRNGIGDKFNAEVAEFKKANPEG